MHRILFYRLYRPAMLLLLLCVLPADTFFIAAPRSAGASLYESFDQPTLPSAVWAIADTASTMDNFRGELRFKGAADHQKYGDPALYSTTSYAHAGGRSFITTVRSSVFNGTVLFGPVLHFSPERFPAAPDRTGYGISLGHTGLLPLKSRFNAVVPGAEISYQTEVGAGEYDPYTVKSINYLTATVLRPVGSYHLVSGGAFGAYPTATLLWVNDHGSGGPLAAGINNKDSQSFISTTSVVDLPGAFASPWGLATAVDGFSRRGDLAGTAVDLQGTTTWAVVGEGSTITTDGTSAHPSPSGRAIIPATPDGIFEADVTSPAAGAFNGGVVFRASGPQNYMFFAAHTNGYRLASVQDGTLTVIADTDGPVLGPGETVRLRVRAHGDSVCVYAGDRIVYDQCFRDAFNRDAVGVGFGQFPFLEAGPRGVAFDNFAAWPRTVTLPPEAGGFPTVPDAAAAPLSNDSSSPVIHDTFSADADLAAHRPDHSAAGTAWTTTGGVWSIQGGSALPPGKNATAVIETNQTDMAVATTVNLSSGSAWGTTDGWMIGPIARYQDEKNYIFARFLYQDAFPEIEVWDITDGYINPSVFGPPPGFIGATNITNLVAQGGTHHLRLVVTGNRVAAYLDGVLTVEGYTYNLTGTKAGMVVNDLPVHVGTFDDFTVQAVQQDAVAPPAIPDLQVTGDTAFPTLTWSRVHDDAAMTYYYKVFRSKDGGAATLIGTPSDNTFVDAEVATAGKYAYTVQPVDRAGNHGPRSAAVALDFTPPDSPSPTPTLAGRASTLMPGANLIANPSFASHNAGKPTGWSNEPTGFWDVTAARSGGRSLRVEGPDGGSAAGYSYQQIVLEPAATYTLSAFVRTQNVAGNGVSLRYAQIVPTTKIYHTESVQGSSDWRFISTTFTTDRDYQSGRLDVVWDLPAGGRAWIDDVVLTRNIRNNAAVNPSMENNANRDGSLYPGNWQLAPMGSWDPTVSRTGSASLKVVGPATFTDSQQRSILKPNTTYVLGFWAKTENINADAAAQGVGIRHVQVPPVPLEDAPPLLRGTNDWTYISKEFTTTQEYVSGRIEIVWQLSAGAAAWIDDVVLCEHRCQ